MRGHHVLAAVTITVIVAGALAAGMVAIEHPAGGQEVDQSGHRTDLPQLRQQLNISQQVRQHVDAREVARPNPTLAQLARAIPAYVAGLCALIVLGSVLGLYEMRPRSILVLLAVIGGIVYKFYWRS